MQIFRQAIMWQKLNAYYYADKGQELHLELDS